MNCWTSRQEAWLGTDDPGALNRLTEDQWAEVDRLAAARLDGATCGWDSLPRSKDDSDCHSGYCVCRWQVLSALCELEAGHAGPHEFVDTRDIILTFTEAQQ